MNGQVFNKYKGQMFLQIMAAKVKKGLFCVADPKYEKNKKVHCVRSCKVHWLDYDEDFTQDIVNKAMQFWNYHIFPLLLNFITR